MPAVQTELRAFFYLENDYKIQVMTSILLKNANLILADRIVENSSVLIESGRIAGINLSTSAEIEIDLQNNKLFAGFIDIHNHGAVGVDVNLANADDLREVGKFLANEGVTAWLPTFVPDSDEQYQKVINSIEEVIETQQNFANAQIVGVHYEGVFANEKMCGALRPEFFKTFQNGDEISHLPRLEKGIHLTTLAPEIENGIALIEEFVRQNWLVSIGHTRADLQTLESAEKAGAKHLTHFFNAMTGIHHRDTGVAGWGLLNDKITFDIIADFLHVAPEMVRFAIKNKTPEKVSLISDSVAPTGLGDGDFRLWGEKISVKNGKTGNERGAIAGSVITMLDAVKNLSKIGFTDAEISLMASRNPAKLLGIDSTHGTIEVNKRADLVVIDKVGDIKLVIVGGKLV